MNPMMPDGGHVFQILGFLVWGAFTLVAAVIALAVAVFFVRFLWFGTKAAKLYIASNQPVVAAPTEDVPVPDVAATKPRKPKG